MNSPKVLSWKLKILYGLLILVFLICIVITVRWAIADIAYRKAQGSVITWEGDGYVPSLAQWQSAYSMLTDAQGYNVNEGEYYRLLGLVHEWRIFVRGEGLSIDEHFAAREKAVDAFRTSTRLRPAWPDSWIYLARQKVALNQFDDELLFTYERGIVLGTYEPRLQFMFTEVGLAAWPLMRDKPELFERFLDNVQRALSAQRRSKAHISIIRATGYLSEICGMLNVDRLSSRAKKACEE